jgi:hypothetical protein
MTARLKREAAWDDSYPAWQDYAEECECLLGFLSDSGALDRFRPRLCSKKQQRDEALNEIRVAYFLQSIGYPVIAWEPEDAPNYNVEYAVSLEASGNAFVEVKSPGWESELTPEERIAGRAKQPKHSRLEGRAAGPVAVIRRTIEKARPKFTGNVTSIVVISDDCFVSLGEWGWGPLQMALLQRSIAYGDGLFHSSDYASIGAVCLFRSVAVFGRHGVEYKSICMANPNAVPKAAVPLEMVARLSTKHVGVCA